MDRAASQPFLMEMMGCGGVPCRMRRFTSSQSAALWVDLGLQGPRKREGTEQWGCLLGKGKVGLLGRMHSMGKGAGLENIVK